MRARDVIEKYNLDEKSWTPKSFHGILHFFFPVGCVGMKELKDYFGECCDITVFFVIDDTVYWYWNGEDMDRLRKSFIAKVHANPQFLDEHWNEWQARLRAFDKVMEKVDATDLSSLSDDELLALYNEWRIAYRHEFGISCAIEDAFSMHSDRFLEPHFREFVEENFHEKHALLTSPVNESFLAREYRDRLSILKQSREGRTDLRELLAMHAKKYHWITNNYATAVYCNEDYFQEQLEKMTVNPEEELARLDRELADTKQRKKELMENLKLDRESRDLIRIAEVFTHIQDERKKYVMMASHYQNLFLEECRKRLGLDRTLAEQTVIDDLPEFFREGPDREELERRQTGSLVINTPEGYELISGTAALETYEMFNTHAGETDELKGTVASPGRAKGPARIVRKKDDMKKMRQGDILIASMTRPEFVPAMKKAAAIVTDEGGITSHAAIVSRELRIPCIIGTKHATKVFKDGNRLEVNADEGTVRRL